MSRYLDSVCKLCRREGEKLFLKGPRCHSQKCSFERRAYPPGEHGRKSSKVKEYGRQLREKQKAKRVYGVLEKQFKRYYVKAARQKGIVGQNLVVLLERRLDNLVYRLGFASSRSQARQLVKHNHFLVNGKRANIPSYLVPVGGVIQVREKSRNIAIISEALELAQHKETPDWLALDVDKQEGVLRAFPQAEQVAANLQTQLIVELYSK